MNRFMAALTSGLAATQAARGAQNTLVAAGWRPPFFSGCPPPVGLRAAHSAGAPRVEKPLFDPPNAIKVGASSDLERSVFLNPYAPAEPR